ncbi:MAG TPA: HPF/RaiA family ribosome-associated protein [Candidatus Staskawiczbacteria bacterium]|nr:HPF/RaiA family ribosome-associated protein [Candidatus Staskawiczbacteria bacterium]
MVTIKSKNLEITEAFNEFIVKKSASLEKLIDGRNTSDIIIEIEKEAGHSKKGENFFASGSVSLPGQNISVQERSEDAKKAIVGMIDDFKVEVKKYKSKNKEYVRKKQRNSDKFLLSTHETQDNDTE